MFSFKVHTPRPTRKNFVAFALSAGVTFFLAGFALPSSAVAMTVPDGSQSTLNIALMTVPQVAVQSVTDNANTDHLSANIADFGSTDTDAWRAWQIKQVDIAADAAAKKAAAKKAAAAKAADLAVAGVAIGDKQQYAFSLMASSYNWTGTDQQACLLNLWNRESGWNTTAANSSSGAYGIPQSLPGSKMASVGSDWKTNYKTQIKWGLQYINGSYGSPCNAWAHSNSVGWY